ncbi:MAG: hypothetical protein LBD21_00930 [Tannerellaceae bacterium]|jgi:hypothetical protein|nr:hypothetical protein [Tannerellaceae bacterium]
MKRIRIVLLTTGVVLFLALSLAGCGGSNGEPEPVPPPVDTVVVEEPPDTVYVPQWAWLWNGGYAKTDKEPQNGRYVRRLFEYYA